MSAEIVNLRRARKAKARTAASDTSAANRAVHGRSKAERGVAEAERGLQEARLSAHRLTSDRDEP